VRGLLDTGHLSWGLDDEHVYTCPCGAWQLHVPTNIAIAFAPSGRRITPDITGWIMEGIRALNAAMDDALWEHEAECPVLQHAAVQAGIVRPTAYPYDWTPEEWERAKDARYSHLRED
jgi:hypothetical protein